MTNNGHSLTERDRAILQGLRQGIENKLQPLREHVENLVANPPTTNIHVETPVVNNTIEVPPPIINVEAPTVNLTQPDIVINIDTQAFANSNGEIKEAIIANQQVVFNTLSLLIKSMESLAVTVNSLVETFHASMNRPLEFKPIVNVPETTVNVDSPVEVHVPERKRKLLITHSDGTKSTVTEE